MNLGYKRYLDFFFFLQGYITFKVTGSKDPELQLPDCLCDWKYIVGKKHVGLCHLLQVTYLVSFQFSHPKLKEFIIEKIQAWFQGGLSSYMYISLSCWGFHPPV